jgi:hypothetical protein
MIDATKMKAYRKQYYDAKLKHGVNSKEANAILLEWERVNRSSEEFASITGDGLQRVSAGSIHDSRLTDKA